MSSSAHKTSFVQEDGESDDSDSNKKDSRENTNRLRQFEAFDSEDVDSADDQHENSYGGSQYKPYVSPVNQESTAKKRKIVVTPQNIKPNQIKQTGST